MVCTVVVRIPLSKTILFLVARAPCWRGPTRTGWWTTPRSPAERPPEPGRLCVSRWTCGSAMAGCFGHGSFVSDASGRAQFGATWCIPSPWRNGYLRWEKGASCGTCYKPLTCHKHQLPSSLFSLLLFFLFFLHSLLLFESTPYISELQSTSLPQSGLEPEAWESDPDHRRHSGSPQQDSIRCAPAKTAEQRQAQLCDPLSFSVFAHPQQGWYRPRNVLFGPVYRMDRNTSKY